MKVTTEHDLERKTVNTMRDREHYPFVPEHVKITSADDEIVTVEIRGLRLYTKAHDMRVRIYTGRDLWLRPKWLDTLIHTHQTLIKENA